MKIMTSFMTGIILSVMSFCSVAQTVSAVDSTLDGAEAKIAAQAQKAGASYKITSARFNNKAYVTAELTK